MEPDEEALVGAVMGAARAVHRELGPGFVELTYENALVLELRAREIPHARQPAVPVSYRGVVVGVHRIDVFVAQMIVVELKTVKELLPVHFAVVRSYMRASRASHGLLLNFAKPALDAKVLYAW